MYHQDLEYYIKNLMDLQEAVYDKEAFCEELRTQKLKVAGGAKPRDTGDSSGTEGQ